MKLDHPFCSIVVGPPRAGKTYLTIKLINNADEMLSTPPAQIFYCYSENQPAFETLPAHVQMIHGKMDIDKLSADPSQPKLLVLDDLIIDYEKDRGQDLDKLFAVGSHHLNTSIILLTQNLFHGKSRTSRISTHYFFLLKSPGDKLSVMNFARQSFPGQQNYFMESYTDAVSQKHGYLFVDNTTSCEDDMRLSTNIFPNETQIFYLPK